MQPGYARVSTLEQNTQQLESALKDTSYGRVFIDHGLSGAEVRPNLNRLLDQLRSGDIVVVTKLDCLSRSLTDVLDIEEGTE